MYVIIGVSKYGNEVSDCADTREEALYLRNEYRDAFGPGWDIYFRKRRISDDLDD